MSSRFATTEIQRYYDRHTTTFVAYGQGGSVGAIHRAVWGPGAASRQQAFRYVEDLIADRIRHLHVDSAHIVDLGCGIAASLGYLAAQLPIQGTGITVSPVQASLGSRRLREAGLSDRVRCLEGDYCALPDEVGTADLAYAVESFVHGPDPTRFFAQCGRLVRPGGWLLVCDDFRRRVEDPRAPSVVDRFCEGWHVNTLLYPDELVTLAARGGFDLVDTVDLTGYLELGRPRDRVVDLLVGLGGWIPALARRYDYLVGGSALQTCLRRGWIGYDLASFRRRAA